MQELFITTHCLCNQWWPQWQIYSLPCFCASFVKNTLLFNPPSFLSAQLDAIEARASAAEAAAARLRGRAGRDAKANAMNEVAVCAPCPEMHYMNES
jgi:hypothetical protein